jgi:N-acetylneuraminic acid mutarotase
MKLIFLFLLLFTSTVLISQTWTKIADFPGVARDDGAHFVIGNNVYCGLGSQAVGGCANDFYSFDLTTETWSVCSSMLSGQQRQYSTGFSVNGKGYVFGGINCSGVLFNDLWEYNSVTNGWIQKTNMPALERYGCVSFVINNIAYIVGGKTAVNNGIPDVWAYDPLLDSWIQKTSMPINGMWRGVSYQYNNLGIVGLGLNGLNQYNKLFYEYNPSLNSWNTLASLSHTGLTYAGYAQINQNGYLFGGIDSLGIIHSEFEKIDLQNYTMTSLTPFSDTARKGCMTFCGTDAFYLTTGISSTKRFNSTWKATQIVGMKELEKDNSFLIYPNPVTDFLTISSKDCMMNEIEIMDIYGKTVFQQILNSSSVNVKLPMDKGSYILLIVTDQNKITHQKLIIE